MVPRPPHTFWLCRRLAALLIVFSSVLLAPAGAGALTFSVARADGKAVRNFRWIIEEDLNPGAAAVAASGRAEGVGSVTVALDGARRYFLSVAPEGGYAPGGAPVAAGQGTVRVTVNKLPLPAGELSVLVFEDNHPVSAAPDLPQERGLEGFRIYATDAAGRRVRDFKGNPLGTLYDAEGGVVQAGSGFVLSGRDGQAILRNLPPGKLTVYATPPLGEGWLQTTPGAAGRGLSAWVRPGERAVPPEFTPSGRHAAVGFIRAMNERALLKGGRVIRGQVVSRHDSKPPEATVYFGEPVKGAWVGLNEVGGRALYAAPCDPATGAFAIANVPPGDYRLVCWDGELNFCLTSREVTVSATQDLGLGKIPLPARVGRLTERVFRDKNGNGFPDPGEPPLAGRLVGRIHDPLGSAFDPASPTFCERYAPPFVPVSIRDWSGREVSRVYTDALGSFSALLPSACALETTTPLGFAPGLFTVVVNAPGESCARQYGQAAYPVEMLPGATTCLDAPLGRLAAYAGGEANPPDLEPPDGTPIIASVSGPGGGPVVSGAGQRLTITAVGRAEVPNPLYDPKGSQPRTVTRDYGFGAAPGRVTLGGKALTGVVWGEGTINGAVPAGVVTGQLVVTRASGVASPVGVTVTVGAAGTVRTVRPSSAAGAHPIQDAIDAAGAGDLILIAPGRYAERVIVWKPVRLQGWGAGATVLDAGDPSAAQLAAWRAKIKGLITGGKIDLLPGQPAGLDPGEAPAFASEEGAAILVAGRDAAPAQGGFGPATRPRIDGLTVTGGTGGGIVASGYSRNLEISNNIISENQGAWGGGIRSGHPGLTVETADGADYDRCENDHLNIHHNLVRANAGRGGAGGGIALYGGSDGYRVEYNTVLGNFTAGSGGGIGHLGLSPEGRIAHNRILFNQSFGADAAAQGGGVFIGGGAPLTLGGLTAGAGSVKVTANLIQGNQAGSGDGGGVALAAVNGRDVAASPNAPTGWWRIDLANNVIVNNQAGLAGGGIALRDAASVNIIHNTVARNESTATAGEAFAPGSPNRSAPRVGGVAARAHSAALAAAFGAQAGVRGYKLFSNPRLVSDIFWQNRSFYFQVNAGNAARPCGLQPPVAAPAYNDLGVTGVGTGGAKLGPLACLLTDRAGYDGSNVSGDPRFTEAAWNGDRALGLAEEVSESHLENVQSRGDSLAPEYGKAGRGTNWRTKAKADEDVRAPREERAKARTPNRAGGGITLIHVKRDLDGAPTAMMATPALGAGPIAVRAGPLTLTSPATGKPFFDAHLLAGSAALGAGSMAGLGVLPETVFDFDGQPRPSAGPEIGADEYYPAGAVTSAAPVACADAFTLKAGAKGTVEAPGVLGNDLAASGNPLQSARLTNPAHGTLALRADGSFDYTPAAGFSGTDSFTYQARDGQAASHAATVRLSVGDANRAPAPTAAALTTLVNTTGHARVRPNDPDPEDFFTYTFVLRPAHGTAAITPGGLVTYTPAAGFTGRDSFTVRVADQAGASGRVIVPITVTPRLTMPGGVATQYQPDSDGIDTDGDGVVNNDHVFIHLGAGDGFARMADGKVIYVFGFSDLGGLTNDQVMAEGMLRAESPGPALRVREGQRVWLNLSNVGLTMRPDRADAHSAHWAGLPNAAPAVAGEPETSMGALPGGTFTYYFQPGGPGTYLLNCAAEAPEHVQMGLTASLCVTPKQDGRRIEFPAGSGRVYQRFAYDDGDGSTGYDFDVPLLLGGFDPAVHDAELSGRPLPEGRRRDRYPLLNGRGYPDTAAAGALAALPESLGRPAQKLSARIEARQGQRVLLRVANLAASGAYTLTCAGIPLEVVGVNAKLLRAAGGKNIFYKTTTLTTGGGEACDAILDTAGVAPGTYFLYAANLNCLSNDKEDYGGMMTEVVVR